MTLIPNSSPLISGEVISSNMNVIGDGNNQFARLLDSMPAKRVGRMEDVGRDSTVPVQSSRSE